MKMLTFFGVYDSREIGATDKFKEIFDFDINTKLGYLIESKNDIIELVTNKSAIAYNIKLEKIVLERMFFPLALNEDVSKHYTASGLGKKDKAVIKAFSNKETLDGNRLTTDGKTLDMQGIGGKAVAKWDNGQISFRTATGRSDQALIKTLKKLIDPYMINESSTVYTPDRVKVMQQYVADTEGLIDVKLTDAIIKIFSDMTWSDNVADTISDIKSNMSQGQYSELENAFKVVDIDLSNLGQDEQVALSFIEEDAEDYNELKNAQWPASIHPVFDDLNLTITFGITDDAKEIAKFVDSLIDFGDTTAHEVLGITEEILDVYPSGDYNIWYSKNFRDTSAGPNAFYKDRALPNDRTISNTHALIGSIQATDLNDAYYKMQGEEWSPNGEACDIINELGLDHTSMSVGDIIERNGILFIIDKFGFMEVPKEEVLDEGFGTSDWAAIIRQVKDENDILNNLDAAIEYAAEDWMEELGYDNVEDAAYRIKEKYLSTIKEDIFETNDIYHYAAYRINANGQLSDHAELNSNDELVSWMDDMHGIAANIKIVRNDGNTVEYTDDGQGWDIVKKYKTVNEAANTISYETFCQLGGVENPNLSKITNPTTGDATYYMDKPGTTWSNSGRSSPGGDANNSRRDAYKQYMNEDNSAPAGIDEEIYNALHRKYVADALDHVFSMVPRNKEQWFEENRDRLRKWYISHGLIESITEEILESAQTTMKAGFDMAKMPRDMISVMFKRFDFKPTKSSKLGFTWTDPKGNKLVTYYNMLKEKDGLMGYVGLEGSEDFVNNMVDFFENHAQYKDFEMGARNYI